MSALMLFAVFGGYVLIFCILQTLRHFFLGNVDQNIRKNAKFFIPTILETIVINIYVSFFIAVTINVKLRLNILNEILVMKFQHKTLKKWIQNNIQNILNSYSSNFVLKMLSILHIQLNEAIKLINTIFLLPVAFFIALNLCGLTFSLYETYDLIVATESSLSHLGYNMAIYLLNLHYFIYTFSAILISVSTANSRDETCKIMKNILIDEFNDKCSKQIRIFKLQIKSSRFDFSCGLFDFNWTLLFSVSVKIMLYFMII